MPGECEQPLGAPNGGSACGYQDFLAPLAARQSRLRSGGRPVSVCLFIVTLGVNVRFCRDEVCRITVYQAGGPCLRMRTSEPRDRAWWTLAASVPQADIDYGAWSSCRATRTRTRRYARSSRPVAC